MIRDQMCRRKTILENLPRTYDVITRLGQFVDLAALLDLPSEAGMNIYAQHGPPVREKYPRSLTDCPLDDGFKEFVPLLKPSCRLANPWVNGNRQPCEEHRDDLPRQLPFW